MTIVEKFNREIEGEKLLYSRKENYSKEESKLIVETVANRMQNNMYYGSLLHFHISLLEEKILPNIDEEELKNERRIINDEIDRRNSWYLSHLLDEYDYAHYIIREFSGIRNGIKNIDSYFETILEKEIDAQKLKSVFDEKFSSILKTPSTDMLLTANMMFNRYPDFYDDEYVLVLSEMIRRFDQNKITDKDEREKYVTAKKTTIRHIKNYTKIKKQENKENKKQLKKAKKA